MQPLTAITIALVFVGVSSDPGFPKFDFPPTVITVGNGGPWGSWGRVEVCPRKTRAIGFSIVVEPEQGRGDDTSLNGIRLHCLGIDSYQQKIIASSVERWGASHGRVTCLNGGSLVAFQLRVESPIGNGDDTAANNINFKCDTGEILYGTGTEWGEWSEWSIPCDSGICGIQTKVEPAQGDGDDTALNDVAFICCH